MLYRRLGKSGLKVSALSLGSWLTFGKQIDDDTAEKLMVTAYDQGVNFFDNAEIYARGESERVMGRILKNQGWSRDSYIVSSKVFFGDGGQKPTQKGLNRKHVFEACDAALQRLQVEYLDLYFCHRPDKETPIEETVWAMNDLMRQGKILYWGTSEWSAQEIMEAHRVAQQYRLVGPTMEQPQYNLFHRDKVEVEYKRMYDTVGLGLTVWSPLASGVLSGKYNDGDPGDTRLSMQGLDWLRERQLNEERVKRTQRLTDEVAKDLGISMPQLALAWCLHNEHVSTVILGASKQKHLKENLATVEALNKLTPDVVERIESIVESAPTHPDF